MGIKKLAGIIWIGVIKWIRKEIQALMQCNLK